MKPVTEYLVKIPRKGTIDGPGGFRSALSIPVHLSAPALEALQAHLDTVDMGLGAFVKMLLLRELKRTEEERK